MKIRDSQEMVTTYCMYLEQTWGMISKDWQDHESAAVGS